MRWRRDAVVREVKEELEVDSCVNKLAFVVENQFTPGSIAFHNIEFHFIVEPIGEIPDEMIEGKLKQTCECDLSVDKLVNLDVVPAFLAEELPNWDGQIKHIMNMKEKTNMTHTFAENYDVIVIETGHAGVEAGLGSQSDGL